MFFIKTSLSELITSPKRSKSSERKFYLEILHNFYSTFSLEKLDDSQLLKLILQTIKSTLKDIDSLSTLFIGDLLKTSIIKQLRRLINAFENDVPNKIQQKQLEHNLTYFQSLLSKPLISAFYQLIAHSAIIYCNVVKCLCKVQSNVKESNYSLSKNRVMMYLDHH
jgi:hypothetical protein